MITENEAYSCYHDVQNSPVLETTNQPNSTVDKIPISFLELLNSFGVDSHQPKDKIISQLQENLQISLEDLEEIVSETVGKSLNEMFNPEAEEENLSHDTAMIFAERVLGLWINKIQQLKNKNPTQDGLTLSIIIDELIKTRNRIQLRKNLYNAVKEEVENFSINGKFDVVARIAFQVINDFVGTFGWSFTPEDERPLDPESSPIFSHVVVNPNEITPNIDRKFAGERIFKNWSIGTKEAFTKNVLFEQNVKKPQAVEMNRQLGDIILDLKSKHNELQ